MLNLLFYRKKETLPVNLTGIYFNLSYIIKT